MRKIPTLYLRDPDDRAHVLFDVTPGCEWVLAGEGTPTRKYDGTCTLLDEAGNWWARREVKRDRPEPENFRAEEYDLTTGKTVGWEPMAQSPFAKFHAEALATNVVQAEIPFGTYELIGPKINGNPEDVEQHTLVRHATAEVFDTIDTDNPVLMVIYAGDAGWEGIVWHHQDGRMAKLKVRDIKPANV